jgi:hypothetical protein
MTAMAALVTLSLAPGSASAATLGSSGSTLEYRAAAGATDRVFLKYRRNRDFYFVSEFSIGHIAVRAPCFGGPDPDRPDYGQVIAGCPAAGLQVASFELGDRNDVLTGMRDEIFRPGGEYDDALPWARPLAVYVDGGAGADQIDGGVRSDRLRGGSGNDRISGFGGNDLIRGGSGRDFVMGGGKDRIYGDSGADTLIGVAGSDRIYGGPGNDTINGGGRFVRGDRRDRISGGSGADTLFDFQSGRESAGDRFSGGPGNDKIDDRDGNRDVIDCGTGRDSVVADRRDKVARNCERVRRR